jgi:hypothetical protein
MAKKDLGPVNPRKEFERLIRDLSYRHQIWRVFSDFCEMAAIALGNVVHKDQEQEDRYHEILKNYDETERAVFPKLLGLTVLGLESLDSDFLGEMFMGLELSNHYRGQFFTPFHLCQLMAKVTIGDDTKEKIEAKGFITVNEPACGAGATILGLAAAMRDQGLDYQRSIHVTAIDVDSLAANMCFVQLAMHHIPAAVYTGNTLTMDMRSVRYTPAHHLGFWHYKLKSTKKEVVIQEGTSRPKQEATPVDLILPGKSQYQLFEMEMAA